MPIEAVGGSTVRIEYARTKLRRSFVSRGYGTCTSVNLSGTHHASPDRVTGKRRISQSVAASIGGLVKRFTLVHRDRLDVRLRARAPARRASHDVDRADVRNRRKSQPAPPWIRCSPRPRSKSSSGVRPTQHARATQWRAEFPQPVQIHPGSSAEPSVRCRAGLERRRTEASAPGRRRIRAVAARGFGMSGEPNLVTVPCSAVQCCHRQFPRSSLGNVILLCDVFSSEVPSPPVASVFFSIGLFFRVHVCSASVSSATASRKI